LSNLTLKAASATLPMKQTAHLLIELLCKDNPDAPFALLYEVASDRAKLSAAVGIDAARAPDFVHRGEGDFWSIGRVLEGEDLVSADHPRRSIFPEASGLSGPSSMLHWRCAPATPPNL
jgi:hypothetical protein